jgi:hypothetical protein
LLLWHAASYPGGSGESADPAEDYIITTCAVS